MGKKTRSGIVTLALGVLLISMLPGCAVNRGGVAIGSLGSAPSPKQGPPPWAPAHGRRAKYRYRYYPQHYIYYEAGRGMYFYLEGDRWRVSANLPVGIHLEYAEYVTLETDTDEPYQYFSEHKKHYPPVQAKKKKKQKKK